MRPWQLRPHFLLTLLVAACRVRGPVGDTQLSWQFTPVWSVGGDADHGLSLSQLYPFQVGTRSNGETLILGAKERRIYVLTSDGKVRDSLGRQGEGPGEFADPFSLTVGPDGSIAVVDPGLRRIVRWSGKGALLDPVPVTFRLDHPRVVTDGPATWYQTVVSVAPGQAENQLLRVTAGDTQVMARVARQPRRVVDFPTCGGSEISVQPFFVPTLVWAAAGGTVAVAEGPDYSVRVYRPDGPPLILTRPLAAVPATEAAALKQAEGYLFNGCLVAPREVVTSIGYLPSIPRIAEIAVAPSGETWIRRRTDDATAFLIDVFDGAGEFLGTLPPDAPFPAAFLPGEKIVVAEMDSLDVPVVAVYSVRRGRAGR